MAQQMMWNQFQSIYRGQATNGTIVTVEEHVMHLALKKAGRSVFDSDWWLESLERVLSHWGINANHWIDATTNTHCSHFSMSESAAATG